MLVLSQAETVEFSINNTKLGIIDFKDRESPESAIIDIVSNFNQTAILT